MTTIRVALAEKPADILVYLVDHGPATALQILAAFGDKVQAGGGLYGGGLTLLRDLGFVDGPPGVHDRNWQATAEGLRVVADAREAQAS
jgi:hypothetical protein